ncbi:Dolichyldiphosphatase 1 [Rhizophlyctis rosea]|nr:Dolichyldiphosphatase 1 [Rhizophlyctis rosea]
MDNTKPLASINLTHVQFDPSDPWGMLMGYASLVPIALLVSYATLILFRRDVATMGMLGGQLTNEAVNYVLKKVVRQARPTSKNNQLSIAMVGERKGVLTIYPSFVNIDYLGRGYDPILKPHPNHTEPPNPLANHSIHLTYHTTLQVLVGLGAGTIYAIFWFIVLDSYIFPLMEKMRILESPLAQFFYIRDTRHVPNVVRWEWEKAEELKARKKTK